jgi:hypothetical protein
LAGLKMSCEGDFEGDSVCSDAEPKPGSKRHSSSNSSSGSKRGKRENPDSKPSGSQKSKSSIENFMSLYIFLKLLGFGTLNTCARSTAIMKMMNISISSWNT